MATGLPAPPPQPAGANAPAAPAAEKRGSPPRLFRLLMGAGLLIMFGFEVLLSSLPVSEELLGELKDFQSRQLDTFMEMNKLLTTLATVAIGASTGFIAGREGKQPVPPGQMRRAVAVWVLLGASIYFGYLATQQVVWMLNSRFFNLYYAGIAWPTRFQFWSFLIAVVVMAEFVYGDSTRTKEG